MNCYYSEHQNKKYYKKFIKHLVEIQNYCVVSKDNNETILDYVNEKHDIFSRIIIGKYKYINSDGLYNTKYYYIGTDNKNINLIDYYEIMYNYYLEDEEESNSYYSKEPDVTISVLHDMKPMYKYLKYVTQNRHWYPENL